MHMDLIAGIIITYVLQIMLVLSLAADGIIKRKVIFWLNLLVPIAPLGVGIVIVIVWVIMAIIDSVSTDIKKLKNTIYKGLK